MTRLGDDRLGVGYKASSVAARHGMQCIELLVTTNQIRCQTTRDTAFGNRCRVHYNIEKYIFPHRHIVKFRDDVETTLLQD
ncbi:hypothetical protein E2C01_026595 [Portunus trituberculatus]|uniref:Uncharacterized protein n=1 Tax=Portunus trituberculatus TaxID=210409 RepID=A0A5B7EFZ5_PORTR|nr:hypothetical protein [Portunus trituberculatus]